MKSKLVQGDPVWAIDGDCAVLATVTSASIRLAVSHSTAPIRACVCAIYNGRIVRACLPRTEGLWWARGHAPETADALEAANKLLVSSL